MKHAFLIIAHNEPKILMTLVSLLDHKDCDIYIHIDKKTDLSLFSNLQTKHSKLHILKDRINVKWGDYSQILTEIKLFEIAHQDGPYSYYHLLSGTDLPIKPIDVIIKWFKEHDGYEYLGAGPAAKKYRKRMHHRYFFITRKRNLATTIILAFEKLFRLKWNKDTEVWMGPNWGSFTNRFVECILANKKWIERHFKYSFCGDELYKATLMRHLGLEHTDKGSIRLIDWERGEPYTFKYADFDELRFSNKLFARKFSSEDMNLILKLYYLNNA